MGVDCMDVMVKVALVGEAAGLPKSVKVKVVVFTTFGMAMLTVRLKMVPGLGTSAMLLEMTEKDGPVPPKISKSSEEGGTRLLTIVMELGDIFKGKGCTVTVSEPVTTLSAVQRPSMTSPATSAGLAVYELPFAMAEPPLNHRISMLVTPSASTGAQASETVPLPGYSVPVMVAVTALAGSFTYLTVMLPVAVLLRRLPSLQL